MLGLGSYESSSEDENSNDAPVEVKRASNPPIDKTKKDDDSLPDVVKGAAEDTVREGKESTVYQTTTAEPVAGPAQSIVGPLPPADYTPRLPEDSDRPFSDIDISSLRRDMTLPPFPNFDIPPSPPGSPNPEMNKKFEHFLALKKEGIHFNEKLASSSSLKNPNLLQSLMKHAGLDERAQYASSLPKELWDLSTLPSWAYKVELDKFQQSVQRSLEEAKVGRDSIEFVPGSRSETPTSSKPKSSAAERVMAGLSREPSPLKPEAEKRQRRMDLEHRSHRSRSPGRRKRSRSR